MSAGMVYRRSATEAEMIKAFSDLATAGRGYCWHVRDARRQQTEGMPDLVIVLPPVLAMIEIKTQRDVTSALQERVIWEIEQCSLVYSGVVRPVPKHEGEMTMDEAIELIVRHRPDLEVMR